MLIFRQCSEGIAIQEIQFERYIQEWSEQKTAHTPKHFTARQDVITLENDHGKNHFILRPSESELTGEFMLQANLPVLCT